MLEHYKYGDRTDALRAWRCWGATMIGYDRLVRLTTAVTRKVSRQAQIIPCKVYFCGPEINVSNRVLRQFHEHIDNFLRVSFVDEELDKLYSADLSTRISEHRRSEIYDRILSILRNGLDISGKKFEFLAFSSSQLRENSLWMFARTPTGLTADSIREWMGDFSRIKNVAKYAARLGQSFGSSTETSVAKKCDYDPMPSAFQIRYGWYNKGVVAVDPNSSVKLSLRKSMHKYDYLCILVRNVVTAVTDSAKPKIVSENSVTAVPVPTPP
ncbi:hypothetical protein TSUD_12130 [Trifolium subterraneum]|uniref:RNA-dependent RNA polymerase n=1 Tax=Trifolium subterraneum TaxID=3900 RepID=A0A2Z6LPI2_TRISU|nr:hypothetical protein TSUD_12130 [Trifolium subterraneum]